MLIFRKIGALLVVFFFSAFGAPCVANAKMKQVFNSGNWSVYKGHTAAGKPACELFTAAPDNSRFFSIDYFPGATSLQGMIIKPTWSIPKRTLVPIIISVGGDTPYHARAVGDGDSIWWAIPRKIVDGFVDELANENRMVIVFQAGNEPPWTISLNGSDASIAVFVHCMAELVGKPSDGGSTQPFNTSPTEPYAPHKSNGGDAPKQEGAPGSPSAGGSAARGGPAAKQRTVPAPSPSGAQGQQI